MTDEQDENFRWVVVGAGFLCTVVFSPIYAIVICAILYIAWYGGAINAAANYYEQKQQPKLAEPQRPSRQRQPQAAQLRPASTNAAPAQVQTPASTAVPPTQWQSYIETEPPALLEVIGSEPMIVIVGEKGSGKSTVARHIADQYESVIVLDPHAERDTETKTDINWPASYKVIGYGRNFAAINATITGIRDEMTRRYQAIGNGQINRKDLPRVLVVTDEAIAINTNCIDFAAMQRELITEARKVHIALLVATHSDNVEALGLKGLGNLREGYAVVKLKRDRDGQRTATVKIGSSDPFPVSVPGPYKMPQFPTGSQTVPTSSQTVPMSVPERPEPAGTEAEPAGTGQEPSKLVHPPDWLKQVINAPMFFDAMPVEIEKLPITLDEFNKIAQLVKEGASLTTMQNEVRKRRETVKAAADYIRKVTA